ncbi:hypothetical protein ACG02S_08235 [Roseateles sp. DC23W]|uniref:Uncharacterized protein n=1 Tax=Pelomonas dachongensis TaxID=3299029 RepID=A0ABW7EPD4_9BURK
MKPLISVTHRLDLPAAATLLSQLEGAEVLLFDPQLFDQARALGLGGVRLARGVGPSFMSEVFRRARSDMAVYQSRLDAALAELLPEAAGCHWGYFNTFYALLNLRGYAAIGRCLVEDAPAGAVVHLLGAAAPYRYGQPSAAACMAMAAALQGGGVPHRSYLYDAGPLPEPELPDWRPLGQRAGARRWAHLPTCFYDKDYLAAQILAAPGECLQVPAQFYDVELSGIERLPLRTLTEVRAALGPVHQQQCEALAASVRPVARQLLEGELRNEGFLQLQVQALVDALLLQFTLFHDIEQQGLALPEQLLLSNHDSGLHGGLLSLSRRHRLQVLMLPHAKFQNIPLPKLGGQMQCLHHPVQGADCRDTDDCRVPGALLRFGERHQPVPESAPAQPLGTLGVLLSGLSHNGLSTADIHAYLDGLRQLLAWGRRRGVEVLLRYKPTEGFPLLLQESLGVTPESLRRGVAQPLVAFVQGCDACLGYDIPTSAAIEPLMHAVPMLHCQLRSLVWEEKALMDREVVPSLPLGECIDELDAWWRDPVLQWDFQRRQHARVAQRLADSPSLLQYLR